MKGIAKTKSGRRLRPAVRLLTAVLVVVAAVPITLPARVAHAQNPGFTEFPISGGYVRPQGIVVGPDGNLWFSETTGPDIGKITPSGTITYYPIPASSSFVQTPYITNGPDGNLWFVDWGNNAIGKSTTTGSMTEYAIPTANSGPAGIVTGSDGNLWFTESNTDKIGRITPSGTVTEFSISSGSGVQSIAAGPDGNLWFAEQSANKIGQITTSGTVTEFSTASGSVPVGIVGGPDGNIWFTEYGTGNIAKTSTSGTLLAEYPIVTSNANLQDITVGPDGNLWFAENGSNTIGSITTGGTVNEYATGFSSGPVGITTGPDGNIWYTGYGGPSIGRFSLNACANLTNSASQSPIGSGVPETVSITVGSCGLAPLQNATTTTTTTVPSGCPTAAAIPSFTSNLSFGQTDAHSAMFTAPSCAGTYMVMSQTTVGSTVLATASTSYVVLAIGGGVLYPTNTGPAYVTAGSDGNMWFTDFGNLVQVTVPTGMASHFSMSAIGGPRHIASGVDGNLYVDMGGKIAQLSVAPALSWEVPVTGSINDLEPGPDGNVWFTTQTSSSSGLVGFVTPGAKVKMFKVASGQGVPKSITAGPDGALWYTLNSGQVGRVTSGGVTTALYPIIGGLNVGDDGGGTALGPDGNMWFTAASPATAQNYIVRMSPAGTMQAFPTPTVNPEAGGITAGADGNVWFNEPSGHFFSCENGSGVGRVTPAGLITEFDAGGRDCHDGFNIAAGPDGNVWNAAYYNGGANMIETGAPTACTPLRGTPSATSVSPGSTETVATSIGNCARALRLMRVDTKTIPPTGCGTATTTHVNVPLGPRLGTTVTTSSVAPSCAGTYKVTSRLSVGSTVIGSITVTYQVT